jgi:hypothetical protein
MQILWLKANYNNISGCLQDIDWAFQFENGCMDEYYVVDIVPYRIINRSVCASSSGGHKP